MKKRNEPKEIKLYFKRSFDNKKKQFLNRQNFFWVAHGAVKVFCTPAECDC